MLSIGEIFLYGENGVCRVEDIRSETFHKQEQTYYIIRPLSSASQTIHIPVDSTFFKNKMRRIISPDEIKELARDIGCTKPYWIDNDNERGQHFRQVLSECDRRSILHLLKSIHAHKEELTESGKKLRASDEAIAKRAEKIICEEVSIVMNIDPEEVFPFLFEEAIES